VRRACSGSIYSRITSRDAFASGLTESPIYDGLTGGRMPFWPADRLSDDELRDLIALIVNAQAPDPDPSNCASTHAKIGQLATLTTRFHGVRGTAEIIDD
jgi:hypothetical protein